MLVTAKRVEWMPGVREFEVAAAQRSPELIELYRLTVPVPRWQADCTILGKSVPPQKDCHPLLIMCRDQYSTRSEAGHDDAGQWWAASIPPSEPDLVVPGYQRPDRCDTECRNEGCAGCTAWGGGKAGDPPHHIKLLGGRSPRPEVYADNTLKKSIPEAAAKGGVR